MNVETASYIYDELKIEGDNGLKLPSWVNASVHQELKNIANNWFTLYSSQPFMHKLRNGLLLNDIVGKLNEEQYGYKKVYIYSTVSWGSWSEEVSELYSLFPSSCLARYPGILVPQLTRQLQWTGTALW